MEPIIKLFSENTTPVQTSEDARYNFQNPDLQQIPLEVWYKIFGYLIRDDLWRLESSCIAFKAVLLRYPRCHDATLSAVKLGQRTLLKTFSSPVNIVEATRREITLEVNTTLKRLIRSNQELILEETLNQSYGIKKINFKNYSVFIKSSPNSPQNYYHCRDRPLNTLKVFPFLGDSFFAITQDTARQVCIKDSVINVIQYIVGEKLTEQWNILCGEINWVHKTWKTVDHEIYCFNYPNTVTRLVLEPPGLQKCVMPNYSEEIKSMKAIGSQLFLHFDKRLVCCFRNATDINKFECKWKAAIGEFDEIEKISLRNGYLCVEFTKNHGWINLKGWGEYKGYSDVRSTLVILDVQTGEILYKNLLSKPEPQDVPYCVLLRKEYPKGFTERWDFCGSILLTYSTHSNSYSVRNLMTNEFITFQINQGKIWRMKIQQDTGAIIMIIQNEDYYYEVHEQNPPK